MRRQLVPVRSYKKHVRCCRHLLCHAHFAQIGEVVKFMSFENAQLLPRAAHRGQLNDQKGEG